MAQVQLRDQQGRPVPGVTVRLAFRGYSTDKALFEQIADGGGNTDFGYAAAGIIAINANAHPDQQWTLHVNKNAGFNANWQAIEQKAVDVPGNGVAAFQQDVAVMLQVAPPQPAGCPVDHDKDQFRAWFDRVKVGSTVTTAAMQQMEPALKACGFEWQNNCRQPSEWRPRIHQPPFISGPCSGSTHDVDCGDFGGPWVLTFRY